MANTVSVLNAASATVTVRTAFDQTTPVVGSQYGLTCVTTRSLTVPGTATTALIQIEGANVRWRDDGSAPTASVGFLLYAGAAPQVFAGNMSTAQFIQVAATATINVQYYV